MKTLSVPLLRLEFGMRWTARVLAALLVGMVLLFFIADVASGGTSLAKLTISDVLALTGLLVTCIAMAVAWRWPIIGGVITSAMILLYYAVELVRTGAFRNNIYFDLMLLVGILFMVSGFMRQRTAAVGQ